MQDGGFDSYPLRQPSLKRQRDEGFRDIAKGEVGPNLASFNELRIGRPLLKE